MLNFNKYRSNLNRIIKNYKKGLHYFPIFFIVILFSTIMSYTNILGNTNGQAFIMSKNGLQMEIILPSNATDIKQINDSFIMMKLDNIAVSLSVDKSSVKYEVKLSKNVYEALKKDNPDTTLFEKVPDKVIKTNNYSISKTIYNGSMDKPITYIKAVSKLNYRYVYNISIRSDGDISYDMLNEFTDFKITKTPLKLDNGLLIICITTFSYAVFVIISQIRKKYFWKKSTGIITSLNTSHRVASIYITHYLENGKKIDGEFSIANYGAYPYFHKEGIEVNISYPKGNPKKLDITTNKAGVIEAIFFIFLTLMGIYIMIFQL